jgi:hypothetical protein
MARRRNCLFLLLGALSSLGASYRTPNFIVQAATPQIAQQVGQYAEHYRREKALQWLGHEMPQWGQPCPLRVTVTMGGSGGATSFAFDRGRVLGQDMHIEGTLDRLLASVLPHEVTHTVFAFHFRQPVPRWADEGGSVLSEDEVERRRHDRLIRQLLNARRAMPLRRLFSLREYPPDVMVLYAQGYSVSEFLVSKSSRPAFLNFLADGMRAGWDQAAKAHYGYQSVEELERAWLQHLRDNHQPPPTEVASRPAPQQQNALSQQVVVRLTAPPVQPFSEQARPIYRAVPPAAEDQAPPFQPTAAQVPLTPAAPPAATLGPPVVTLGPPEFSPPPPPPMPVLGQPVPLPGYPQ